MNIDLKSIWLALAIAWVATTPAILFDIHKTIGSWGIILLLFLVFLLSTLLIKSLKFKPTSGHEKYLRSSHCDEMEALIESLPDIVYRLDSQGRILFINNAVSLYGYDPWELRGTKLVDLVHQSDRQHAELLLRERRTGSRSTKHVEIRFTASGKFNECVDRVLLVDAWGIYSKDKEGNAVYLGSRGVARDITSRKRMERELEESRRMLRAVLDNTPQRIFWKDRQGRFLGANRKFAEDYGLSHPKELVGRTDLELAPDKSEAEFFIKIDKQVMEKGAPEYNIIEPLLTADGVHRWLETSKVPLRDTEGKVIGILGTYQDITERIEAEQEKERQRSQMIQADRMISLGVLVAGVAHEINNPNNIIMMNTPIMQRVWQGCSPLLERYYDEHGEFMLANVPYSRMREEIPELFDGILAGCKRIEGIVSSLLTYSRKDTKAPLELLDINDILRESVALVSNLLGESTNNFSVDYAESLPAVRGASQRIEQVLINLLQNACQALTDRSQAIGVETFYDRCQGMVVVKISDEGCGILPEESERITEPFFTTKRENGGTGLGLSISDGIMKDHGGWLDFDSSPGKGTTVRVYFPATSRTDRAAAALTDSDSGGGSDG